MTACVTCSPNHRSWRRPVPSLSHSLTHSVLDMYDDNLKKKISSVEEEVDDEDLQSLLRWALAGGLVIIYLLLVCIFGTPANGWIKAESSHIIISIHLLVSPSTHHFLSIHQLHHHHHEGNRYMIVVVVVFMIRLWWWRCSNEKDDNDECGDNEGDDDNDDRW